MTKFLSFFNLARIIDSKDFLGISPDCVNGNIIVTLSPNIVIVVKISTQQQICSWSTQEKLSTNVLFDNASKKYVGVFGNRFIRSWDISTTDINSIKKVKLQKSIVGIIPSENGAIVLYTDGTLDTFSETLASPKVASFAPVSLGTTHSKFTSVTDIDVKCVNGARVLTYFLQDEGTKELNLVVVPITLAGQQKILKIRRKDVIVNLSGYAIVEGMNNLMLLTIWSDHRLFLLNLDENIESEKLPGNFVTTISALKVDTSLSIVGIAKNCVAIYGANSNQEGASLLLYNIQFKVVKAQQFFKVFFNCTRIWSIDECIIIAMGQNLSCVSYRMPQELLVDLLGTYIENPTIEGDLINEEDYIQSLCSFNENSHQISKKGLNVECNFKSKDFIDLKLVKKIYKYYYPGGCDQTFIQVDHAKSFADDSVSVVEAPLETQLINRTLFEFLVRQYENCGATEQESSEKLLFLLAKMNYSTKIIGFIRRFYNAPESIFAKAFFSMILKNDPKMLKHKSCETNLLTSFLLKPVFQPISKILFIGKHRNDVESFGLLFLLNYFYELFIELSPMESFCPEMCYLKIEMHIIYWFDVLLNDFFQHLVLSKDIEILSTLSKWAKLISTYINKIKKMEELLILLYNLNRREYITDNSDTSLWYSIEELNF